MKEQIEHLTNASESLADALTDLRVVNNMSGALVSHIVQGLIRDCAALHNTVLSLRSDIKQDAGII